MLILVYLSKHSLIFVSQINLSPDEAFFGINWKQCVVAATTDTFKRYIQFNVIFYPPTADPFWVNAHPISAV